MLQMLRAMNRWELAEACHVAGLPEGARPEEIIRALGGTWWAAPWGAAEEERVLLLRAAEALNLMPRLRQYRHRLGLVERQIYGALIQQAFVAAPEEQQNTLLTTAEAHLEPGQPVLPPSPAGGLAESDRRQLSLQRLVSTGAGLRAVTLALADVPVAPEPPSDRPGAGALLTALASAGPDAWSGRVVEWVRARRGPDLHALFQVLRLCWRQRQRLLTELRASAVALQDEEKQLLARLQSLSEQRAEARSRLPWHRRASSGTGVAIGAMAGAAAEIVMTGSLHPVAPLAAGAGCLWALIALAHSSHLASDATRTALLEGLRRARRQRSALARQITRLEE